MVHIDAQRIEPQTGGICWIADNVYTGDFVVMVTLNPCVMATRKS